MRHSKPFQALNARNANDFAINVEEGHSLTRRLKLPQVLLDAKHKLQSLRNERIERENIFPI